MPAFPEPTHSHLIDPSEATIRPCCLDDGLAVLEIINAAAEAYRETIPRDCWHDPYMSMPELESEMAAGVRFIGQEIEGVLVGVMGIQSVRNVDLIRHAYVRPGIQRRGIGGAMIERLREGRSRQFLVGTWAAATWAIRFYERHDFRCASQTMTALLLRTYWTVSARQIEASVVLINPDLSDKGIETLVAQAGTP